MGCAVFEILTTGDGKSAVAENKVESFELEAEGEGGGGGKGKIVEIEVPLNGGPNCGTLSRCLCWSHGIR